MDYRDHIISDSKVMLGKPVVKGTRISAAQVLKALSEGATADQLIAAYPGLSHIAISAVLAYASDVLSNETLIVAA
jgi:uncharacterized protein (DUF433 family)